MTELRPRLAFRVGVAGHRERVDENDPRLIAAVDEVLGFICDELARLADHPDARRVYAPAPAGERPADLCLVSSLAEGADRLFARRAGEFQARLYAPTPFPLADYEKDFKRPLQEFDDLRSQAITFELDGAHHGGEAQTESYEALGRFVARNCDLLVALWDGEPARGQGGAEATVEYAARTGQRVWWIHAAHAEPPKLISRLAEFRRPRQAPEGAEAYAALGAYIRETILPPRAELPEREGALGQAGATLHAYYAKDRPPLDEFFAETPLPRRAIWRAYNALMIAAAPATKRHVRPEPNRPGPWTDLYLAANGRSSDYGDRYRSSYVIVAALVIVTLTAGAYSNVESGLHARLSALVEIASLFAIGALVVVNYAWRWHERWISYRLLAELARKQRVLSLIGQSLPSVDVAQLVADAHGEKNPPRDAWIAWLFMAHRRATPAPRGTMAEAREEALALGLEMLSEQIEYHEIRRRRAAGADRWVRRISEIFFLATVGFALIKYGLERVEREEALHGLEFWASAVAAVTTAFVGLRVYAEFALLDRQSRHMIAVLKAARADLLALKQGPIKEPQGSMHLGRTLVAATTAMMQDITGWAHLFRVKALEAS